jgi:hypothetical protein
MKPMKRTGWHTTAQERKEYLARFEKSGLSPRVFCDQEGIREHTFYMWRRAAREQEQSGPMVPVRFAEVSTGPIDASGPQRTVAYYFPEGGWLEVAAGTDIRWLAELLQAVRTPSAQ